MDISNKFLVFLLVIAILVTAIGTFYSISSINKFALITGYQTQGNVTVEITEYVAINITQPNCDFGSGYVTPPYAFAELATGHATYPGSCGSDDLKGNWTNESAYNPECMAIRNDGNKPVKLNVTSGKDASEFIGGTDPAYKVWSENKEGGSCSLNAVNPLIPFDSKVEMNTNPVTLCSCVYPDEENDEIYAGCYLQIPDNAPPGQKLDTWTFTATASTGDECTTGGGGGGGSGK